MSYLVLARKYRPTRFSEMVGQEHVTRTLANAIAQHRVHHAYLFVGVRGLGKTTAARILARGLVCENGPTADPCNTCEQCRAIIEGRSADVLEIDGASNNSVDDIRNLREQVNYLPQSARRRIYIIDEVHMLSASAFNALLKTLEEPPPHVTFIFATTDPQKVLGTILSRVSRLDFRRVGRAELVAHMRGILRQEGVDVEEDGLHAVATVAEGSVRDALTQLDKIIAFAADPQHIAAPEVHRILGVPDQIAVGEISDAILGSDASRALEVFDRVRTSACDLSQFGIALLQHLRDLAVLAVCGRETALVDAPEAHLERLRRQAASSDLTRLGQIFDRTSRLVEQLERSRTPQLTLEMGIIDLAQAAPLLTVSDALRKLDALAHGQGRNQRQDQGSSGGIGGATPKGSTSPPSHGREGRNAATLPSVQPQTRADVEKATPEAKPGPPNRAHEAPSTDVPIESELARQLWNMVGAGLERSSGDESSPTIPPPSAPLSNMPASEASTSSAPLQCGVVDANTSVHDAVELEAPVSGFAGWRALVGSLGQNPNPNQPGQHDDLLRALLGEIGVDRFDDESVVLACPTRAIARAQLEHGDLRQRFEARLQAYFGRMPQIRWLDAAPSLDTCPSLALIEAKQADDHRRKVEHEVREDPRIRRLQSEFGAVLRGVEIHETRPSGASL